MSGLRRRLIVAGTLACLASSGCLGEPIPRRVVSGTTFTFPYSEGIFGAAANAGPLMSSDPQRGNVRFVLCPRTGACSPQVTLTTRYITRMFPDPGSRLGLSGMTELVPVGTTMPMSQPANIIGQPIVIADVPMNIRGKFMLTSFVDPPGPAGETPTALQEIEIVDPPPGDAAAQFTNLTRILNPIIVGADATPSLKGFIPYPQLQLSLADPSNMDDRPAAGTIVVRCPTSVNIRGVFESGVLGQNSIVRFKNVKTTTENTVTIVYVDPDRKVLALGIAFELATGTTPAVTPTDFTVTSQALYTPTGLALQITDVAANPGNSFRATAIR